MQVVKESHHFLGLFYLLELKNFGCLPLRCCFDPFSVALSIPGLIPGTDG